MRSLMQSELLKNGLKATSSLDRGRIRCKIERNDTLPLFTGWLRSPQSFCSSGRFFYPYREP